MRHGLCGAAALILLASPGAAGAQASALNGAWRLDVEKDAQARDGVTAAPRGAARTEAPAQARVAMARDGHAGAPHVRAQPGDGSPIVARILDTGRCLSLDVSDSVVTVRADEQEPFTVPLDGSHTRIRRWNRPAEVRAVPLENGVRIESTLEGGVRVTESISARRGGDVAVELRLVLPTLAGGERQPITLRRVYRADP